VGRFSEGYSVVLLMGTLLVHMTCALLGHLTVSQNCHGRWVASQTGLVGCCYRSKENIYAGKCFQTGKGFPAGQCFQAWKCFPAGKRFQAGKHFPAGKQIPAGKHRRGVFTPKISTLGEVEVREKYGREREKKCVNSGHYDCHSAHLQCRTGSARTSLGPKSA
jgi:hypothetical protein